VTVASDVYSLGAVLYELLSGSRPHGLKNYDPAEIADRICLREVTPPSSAGVAALRGDLDTIVLKAMQKTPERRYNSAGQFSEDVHRYLDGMPVLARPDTTGYRMRKFAGRHRVGLIAVTAIIVALTAGVVVSMYQARLARERFDLVRSLTSRFLFDIHGEIVGLPGSTKAQQMVVNTAVEYLDKLSRTAGSDRVLLQDMAEAYGKLAVVQGGGNTSNVARYDAALLSQRRSVEFYRTLTAVDSGKRRSLAGSLLGLARIERTLLHTRDSLEHSREAVRILDDSLLPGPQDPKALEECATAYLNLARDLMEADSPEPALAANLKSQQYLSRLTGTFTPDRFKYWSAIVQQDEGKIRSELGEVGESIVVHERVLRMIEELAAADPGRRTVQRLRCQHLGTLAIAYYNPEFLNGRDPLQAEAVQKRRREVCQALVDSDPRDGMARTDMASAESESVMALIEIDPGLAVKLAQSALARWDDALKTASDENSILRRARAAKRLALAHLAAGNPRDALTRSLEAVATVRALSTKNPNEISYQVNLLFASVTSGQTLAASNRESEARQAYEEAAAIGERLRTKAQAPLYLTLAAAYAFDLYAGYWKDRGDHARAREWFERSRQALVARAEHTTAVQQRQQQAEERLRGLQP
jgi:tetratricopeptide (TPR) repeat protein